VAFVAPQTASKMTAGVGAQFDDGSHPAHSFPGAGPTRTPRSLSGGLLAHGLGMPTPKASTALPRRKAVSRERALLATAMPQSTYEDC